MSKIAKKTGTIVTFYSYKGGVGRSMSLANVAVMLANWGYRTLIIDWDLEAPGLENFFKDFISLQKAKSKPGLIDLLTSQMGEKVKPVSWQDCLVNINIAESKSGVKFKDKLYLITSGTVDDDYYSRVRGFDFTEFYQKHDGGNVIDNYRKEWKSEFDFVLIDSRTGVTDIGGVCTIQLPDMLVLLFTPTNAGFDGVRKVAAKAAQGRKLLPEARVKLLNLPIPTRMDNTESELHFDWIQKFKEGLEELYAPWLPESVDRTEFLLMTKVPYTPYYSFGEGLPVLDKAAKDPARAGYAYEALAALIAKQLNDAKYLLNSRGDYLHSAADPGLDLSYLEEKEAYRNANVSLRQKEYDYDRSISESYSQIKSQRKLRLAAIISITITGIALIVAAYFYLKSKTKEDSQQPTKDALALLALQDSIKRLDAQKTYRVKLPAPYTQFGKAGKPIGIDISRINVVSNWDSLKATGIHFVLMQATTGSNYQDRLFSNNWLNAKKYGLIRGAYHYYRQNVDAEIQASNYFATAKLEKGDLPPIVDLHAVVSLDQEKIILPLLRSLQEHYHAKPIIYATYATAKLLAQVPGMTEYPLWIGVFGNNNRPTSGPLLLNPQLPKGWQTWRFWQFTTEGSLPGVLNEKTKLDLNQFNGDRAALNELLIK
ncbi:GH25 family lysozyme [Mucilaginibacter sp.]|uniref:KGGVGR-motif variant AAA ATPase n=1 Tax=Mucilaginibacter sp. TaxID=1882438 RepID=UPI00260EBD4B|nr:GH25 family lysozyme [Mucilaginibacter sp.]MDB4922911.1 putative ATP/GTP-binding protein [Mucilaginibacter sp.]